MPCPSSCAVCALPADQREALDEALRREGTRPAWKAYGEPAGISLSGVNRHRKRSGVPLPVAPPPRRATKPKAPARRQGPPALPPSTSPAPSSASTPPADPPLDPTAPRNHADRARAIARLIQGQTYGREHRTELAQQWGVTERTVREAERSATIYLAPDRDDIERERVMMLARLAGTRKKALDAEDFRAVIAAEAMIAKIGGLLQPLPPQVTTAPDAIGVEGAEERVAYCERLLLTGRFRAFTTYADLAEAWGLGLPEVAEIVAAAEQGIADVLGDGALRRVRVAAGLVDEVPAAGAGDEGQALTDEELYDDLAQAADHGATIARIRRRRALEAGDGTPLEHAPAEGLGAVPSPAPPAPAGGGVANHATPPDQPPAPPPVRLGAVQPDAPAPAPEVEPAPTDGFSPEARAVFQELDPAVRESVVATARAHHTTVAAIVRSVLTGHDDPAAVALDLDTQYAIVSAPWPNA